MENEKLIKYLLEATRVLKMPRKNIATFGPCEVDYYFLSGSGKKISIREGKVTSRRPRIIMARDIEEIFEGFGNYPEKFAGEISNQLGKDIRVLNYSFKNRLINTSSAARPLGEVYSRILKDLEKNKKSGMSAVIKGSDIAWQISIMKFIVDFTLRSAPHNVRELEEKGMFPDSEGVPRHLRNRIEYLFREAEKDPEKIEELGKLLQDKNLFSQYEDRFFRLF